MYKAASTTDKMPTVPSLTNFRLPEIMFGYKNCAKAADAVLVDTNAKNKKRE